MPIRMPAWSGAKRNPPYQSGHASHSHQDFRTRNVRKLAEDLSFSPAHSLIEHRPIGGVNRARVQIYRYLSNSAISKINRQLNRTPQ